MKTWADFYNFCHADVPGVSTFAAERELRRAAQEFFEKTKVWKVDLDPVYLFSNVEEYDVAIPAGVTIIKIATARDANGYCTDLLSTGPGVAGITFINQNTFRVWPAVTGDRQIHMQAVVMPSHSSLGIDDALFEQYAEVIARGAKARLYLHPQKPYTNPELASICREEFAMAIAREKIAAAKGFSGAPLRTRPQFF